MKISPTLFENSERSQLIKLLRIIVIDFCRWISNSVGNQSGSILLILSTFSFGSQDMLPAQVNVARKSFASTTRRAEERTYKWPLLAKRKEIPFTAKSNGELGLLFMTFSLNLHLFSIRIIPSEILFGDFHSCLLFVPLMVECMSRRVMVVFRLNPLEFPPRNDDWFPQKLQ